MTVKLYLKGRHAIYEALRRLGIKQNDEIIVQAFTCVTVVQPILDLGAIPVYVDVGPKILNPALSQIKKSVSARTKAIIFQHTLGYLNLCRRHHSFLFLRQSYRRHFRRSPCHSRDPSTSSGW